MRLSKLLSESKDASSRLSPTSPRIEARIWPRRRNASQPASSRERDHNLAQTRALRMIALE
jgi:hypothetical protein